MARRLTRTVTPNQQYAAVSSLFGVNDYPFTFTGWVRCRDFTELGWIMGFEDSGDTTFPTQNVSLVPSGIGLPWNGFSVKSQHTIGGNANEGEAQVLLGTDFDATFDDWFFFAGIFTSDDVREGYVYYQGTEYHASGGNTGMDFVVADMDRFIVGHQDRQEPDWDATMDVKNLMVHSGVMSYANVLLLSQGTDPVVIDSANRLALWKCDEQTTGANFIDYDGSFDLVTSGDISYVSDDPRLLVYDSDWDASNLESITVPWLSFYTPTSVGSTGNFVATVEYKDDLNGESAPSADSSVFSIEFISDTGWDGTNLESYTKTGLNFPDDFFATVEYKDDRDGESVASAVDTFTTLNTITVTVTGITNGEDLSGLDYMVFNGQDLSTMIILTVGINESTDVNGDLAIDVSGLGLSDGDPLAILIGDWTSAPIPTSKAAFCYADAVVS